MYTQTEEQLKSQQWRYSGFNKCSTNPNQGSKQGTKKTQDKKNSKMLTLILILS